VSNDPADHDFDWVTARFQRSILRMFARFKEGLVRDVEQRNKLSEKEQDTRRFRIEEHDESVLVLCDGVNVQPRQVSFQMSQATIVVTGSSSSINAVLTLDVKGNCVFVVDDRIIVDWELRKRALEQLFFRDLLQESSDWP
jgi:hypothetical protein